MRAERHYTEDELILCYYGEGRRARADIPRHLEACDACRTLYLEIAGALSLVTSADVPERGDRYGLEIWQRIRHQLPERDAPWWTASRWLMRERLVTVGGAAAIVAVAFTAGRVWPQNAPPVPQHDVERPSPGLSALGTTGEQDARQRILLSAVADHLDKSERVLTDIMNDSSRNISAEQSWAEDLLTASRLYRQDAADVGEPLLADVLDEIERSLLEIVHSPSNMSAVALERLRSRIDAAALLFKVRVLSDELRQRELPPADRIASPVSTPISQS